MEEELHARDRLDVKSQKHGKISNERVNCAPQPPEVSVSLKACRGINHPARQQMSYTPKGETCASENAAPALMYALPGFRQLSVIGNAMHDEPNYEAINEHKDTADRWKLLLAILKPLLLENVTVPVPTLDNASQDRGTEFLADRLVYLFQHCCYASAGIRPGSIGYRDSNVSIRLPGGRLWQWRIHGHERHIPVCLLRWLRKRYCRRRATCHWPQHPESHSQRHISTNLACGV